MSATQPEVIAPAATLRERVLGVTPATYRCTWCRCDYPASRMGRLPGTQIRLCEGCWRWYRDGGQKPAVCDEEGERS